MNNHNGFAPMVEVTRGPAVECVHRGAIAVVDAQGKLVASLGNPKEPVYLRSSAKPFQALALVCSGAADAFGLSEEELAVVCGSHSGEPQHLELVGSVLRKAGLRATDLRCGIHPPFDPAARRALAAGGEAPNLLHNNCSGKHAGMLAAARFLGLPTAGYTDAEHEIQIAIRGLLAFLAGMESEDIVVAVDGCTVPTFQIPLRNFALALARLAAAGETAGSRTDREPGGMLPEAEEDPAFDDAGARREEDVPYEEGGTDEDGFPVSVTDGLRRIWRAMKAHPVLVAGSRGRLCTDLMRVASRCGVSLVAKSGAEGVYAMSLLHRGQALGIALKVEDGAERARNAAALETLFQLGLLPPEAQEPLSGYHHPPVLNRLDQPVGEVRARFRLSLAL